MEALVVTAMRRELEKVALLERLVRLGATDIPHTPHMLMRHRSPGELATLQHGVEGSWNSHVTDPIMRVADKGLRKIPEGKIRQFATSGARNIARDPVGALASNLAPIPGAFPAYTAGKHGLERLIDRVSPLASTAA